MDFISYINSLVYITLLDGFYYNGRIVDADEQGISLIDKTGSRVFLANNAIATIKEISR